MPSSHKTSKRALISQSIRHLRRGKWCNRRAYDGETGEPGTGIRIFNLRRLDGCDTSRGDRDSEIGNSKSRSPAPGSPVLPKSVSIGPIDVDRSLPGVAEA